VISSQSSSIQNFQQQAQFVSPNQSYVLTYQGFDVIENGVSGSWASPNVIGSGGYPLPNVYFLLQSNGQLTVDAVDPSNGATYYANINTNTGGVPPYTLSLGNDGNLLIWDSTGTVIWSNCLNPNSNIPASVCPNNG
jgi:hypothetical protein